MKVIVFNEKNKILSGLRFLGGTVYYLKYLTRNCASLLLALYYLKEIKRVCSDTHWFWSGTHYFSWDESQGTHFENFSQNH